MRAVSLTAIIVLFLHPAVSALDSRWEAVPWKARADQAGGEGGQVIAQIACDAQDGQVLLMGTDVGGLYRSTDGGTSWLPCNIGYRPRGCRYVAIDPANRNRFFAIGSNGDAYKMAFHGVWRSTDQGVTWSSRKPMQHTQESTDGRGYHQLAFDGSSVSGGMTRRIWWSSPGDAPEAERGLYRSDDGGDTWALINPAFVKSILATRPGGSRLYAANAQGLWRSDDQGRTFTRISAGTFTGLSVSRQQPDRLYATKKTSETTWELVRSDDAGATVTVIPTTGMAAPGSGRWFATRISASPANADRLVAEIDTGIYFAWPRFRSADGGRTWSPMDAATLDTSRCFLPANWAARVMGAAWHPTDANRLFASGGDWVAQSRDGGARWAWSNQGYTGVYLGGRCNFIPGTDDILIPTQDYNLAWTTDGGSTWTWEDPKRNGWGGYIYGGHRLADGAMFAGVSDSWGGTRTLWRKLPGSAWESTGLTMNRGATDSWIEHGNGDPKNAAVGFWCSYRTADGGRTWTKMANCQNVITANPQGAKQLYGVRANNTIVRSDDSGVTWRDVKALGTTWIEDLAYDWKRDRIWFTVDWRGWFGHVDGASGTITSLTHLLPDDWQGKGAVSVACDPVDPDVVYVANYSGEAISRSAAARSTDAGATWSTLQRQPGEAVTGADGINEGIWVRVNPLTRDAWFAGNCFGLWKWKAAVAAPIDDLTGAVWPSSVPRSGPSEVKISCTVAGTGRILLCSVYDRDWKDFGSRAITIDASGTYSVSIPHRRPIVNGPVNFWVGLYTSTWSSLDYTGGSSPLAP